MAVFFMILMVLTSGVSTSKGLRAHLHNGFWAWKVLLATFLIIFSFKMPFFGLLKTIWIYIGMIASCLYIIINLLLLVDLSYSWTKKIMNKNSLKCVWYILLISLIVTFIALTILLTIYLFTFFVPQQDCRLNSLFVSTVSGACFFFLIFAICVAAKTNTACMYLLPTAFVSSYVMLIAWSTMTSIPSKFISKYFL